MVGARIRQSEGAARLGSRLWAWAAVAIVLVLAGCDSVEERAEKHYARGLELLEAGQPVKASLEFRNAIRLVDTHARANLELGKIYEEMGEIAAAVFQYRKVVALDPDVLGAHLRLGQLLLAFDNIEEAQKSASVAAQLAPEDPRVLILEAAVALRGGDGRLAREKTDAAFRQSPDSGDIWVMLAALSRFDGDLERALEQVDEGIRRDPENVRAHLYRLTLLSEAGRDAEIGPGLERLIELDPDNAGFLDAMARWQAQSGDLAGAEATRRRLSELEPDSLERALDLVRMIAESRGTEAARAELEALTEARGGTAIGPDLVLEMVAVEVDEGNFAAATGRLEALIEAADGDAAIRARTRLARIKVAEGDETAARALIDAVLEADPKNTDALILSGRLSIAADDFDAAIRQLRAALAEEPSSVEALQLLALAHQRNGSPDLARERLAEAAEASDYATAPLLTYVRLLVAEDRPGPAADLIETVLVERPGDPQLLAALAELHVRTGNFGAAEQIASRLQAHPLTSDMGDRLMAAALAGQARYDETVAVLEGSETEGAYLGAIVATHLRNDDPAAARKAVDEAIAADARNATALRLSATLALLDGDIDGARTGFAEAAAVAPEDPASYLALFRLEAGLGNRDAAYAAVEAGLERTGSPVLRLSRAMLRESAGDVDGAIADYRQLYEEQPGSELVANNLASMLSDNDPTPEDIERAFAIAKRLRHTTVPHFKDTYGWLLHLRGDSRAAREPIEEAARELSNNPIVQYHLGVVLAELGETEAARDALERALELAGDRTLPQIAGAQARLDSLPVAQ